MAKKKYETVEEWRAEDKRLFGGDFMKWSIECPRCGNVATVQEFKDAGAKGPDAACTCCIGKFIYVDVDGQPRFEFAPNENGGAR